MAAMNHVQTNINAAEARYRAGDFSGAAALLAAQAETADTLRLLALCQVKLNQTGEALKLFERAREMAPDDPWVALHYGIGLQTAGRHEEAAKMFRAAGEKLTEDPAPWLNLSGSPFPAPPMRRLSMRTLSYLMPRASLQDLLGKKC